MSAIDDLKYYRDKGGIGLSGLTLEQRALIEISDRIVVAEERLGTHMELMRQTQGMVWELNEAVKVIKDRLDSQASPNQGVHGGHLDDHPTGEPSGLLPQEGESDTDFNTE